MATSKPTVFFLPGGFHTSWIYDTVRNILSNRGFETDASDLVSVGATDASVGMHSDAAHLRSQLVKLVDEGKEIVLVAHSYGGIVASNAVDGLSIEQRAAQGKQGGIILVLYLSALIVTAGRTFLSIAPPSRSQNKFETKLDDFLTAKDPLHNFYNDVEASLATKAIEALQPMSSQVLRDEVSYEPWNQGFEVGYIFTDNDNQLPIGVQKAMASQFPNDSFSANLASGHSPFLNVPDSLADVIEDGISYVFKKRSSV
ncbi:Alpha/Beta hydrolase protein [Xylaria bambusicola]|uniref:Alpha/Beta hydrolase protein n=1 Tax=Xylaria bambusicola TaxID=326684 RepID=UPI002008E791|nr:Alpha/Beta hydrolase protein [Xylaria bambusicola]KAI0514724.1 Alpha/Beta hydrolase protein [Xylaria bambusicola]